MLLYNKDCFDQMKEMANNSIDLIVTDPPYFIGYQGNEWDKKKTSEETYNWYLNFFKECKRLLTDKGSMWMFFGVSQSIEVIKAADDSGLYLDLNNWKSICRQKGRGAKYKFKSQREDIIYLTKVKDQPLLNNNDLFNYEQNITNILNYYSGEVERPKFNINETIFNFKMPYYLSKTEKQFHSCQKSILLLYALIKNSYIPENGTIFDPFLGSGSCAISSKLANKNFIGCELDSEMLEKAKQWIESFDYENYKKDYLIGE